MKQKAPGKAHREGVSILDLMEMFPDEETATKWFEAQVWPAGRCCGHCGSTNTRAVPNKKPMPYRCRDCGNHFSVRTGTALARSKVPLRKWAIAVYLYVTSLKSVSSMKLHRDLKVTQKTAWFMLHRLREAWGRQPNTQYEGPVEVDETYVGGKKKNTTPEKRAKMKGRGAVGKMAVVGVKDRNTNKVVAKVVPDVKKKTLQRFIIGHTAPGAAVYTDEHRSYIGLPFEHETVVHSAGEYVRGQVHTNGVESFWSMLKRAHTGTFHKMSPKHLDRYVQEFAGKHNMRDKDTLDQMTEAVAGLIGRRLTYIELISPNGLSSAARPIASSGF